MRGVVANPFHCVEKRLIQLRRRTPQLKEQIDSTPRYHRTWSTISEGSVTGIVWQVGCHYKCMVCMEL